MFTMKDVWAEEERRIDMLNRSLENYRLMENPRKGHNIRESYSKFLEKMGEYLVLLGIRWQLLGNAKKIQQSNFQRSEKIEVPLESIQSSSAFSTRNLMKPKDPRCVSCELRKLLIQLRVAGVIA
jgi:hypothetical protein